LASDGSVSFIDLDQPKVVTVLSSDHPAYLRGQDSRWFTDPAIGKTYFYLNPSYGTIDIFDVSDLAHPMIASGLSKQFSSTPTWAHSKTGNVFLTFMAYPNTFTRLELGDLSHPATLVLPGTSMDLSVGEGKDGALLGIVPSDQSSKEKNYTVIDVEGFIPPSSSSSPSL
jgi:hypothetical protein